MRVKMRIGLNDFFIIFLPRYIPFGTIGFCNKNILINVPWIKHMRTKKAWHFFAFIGIFEVLDYLILPNYNE